MLKIILFNCLDILSFIIWMFSGTVDEILPQNIFSSFSNK